MGSDCRSYAGNVIRRLSELFQAERSRARALESESAEERGRWFRRLALFEAAVLAFALVSVLLNPALPDWLCWVFGAFLVLALVQAAVAPWIGRHSRPRRRRQE